MRQLLLLPLILALPVYTWAQDPCDSLEFLNIGYAPFSDTAVQIHVLNHSSDIFSYPGFLLFDGNGDTLAMEEVFYFGIGQESVHQLTFHPDANIPTGMFNGTLELWTGFYSDLACSWTMPLELCPAEECSYAELYLGNFGGALVNASFDWMVTDTLQNAWDSGTFVLSDTVQQASAGLCLPPGEYQAWVNSDQITGGQLTFGMGSGYFAFGGPQSNLVQGGGWQSIAFSFYAPCNETINSISQSTSAEWVQATVVGTQLQIRQLEGRHIGTVQLLDLNGRNIYNRLIRTDHIQLDLGHLAGGVYVLVLEGKTTRKLVIGL